MSKRSLNGADFNEMVLAGAARLAQQAEHVNALNVFPVPDGDTGTNMNLTMTAGVTELKSNGTGGVGSLASTLSKGLLMGARGNSGVILSQLFRGFSRYAASYEELNTVQFAAALQSGVDTAYKAVVKPVEGTILTVAKEAAKHAVYLARRTNDIEELMVSVLAKAKEALASTPDLLPVLKQVGVVDSGGQGLVYIYEGFVAVLTKRTVASMPRSAVPHTIVEEKQPVVPVAITKLDIPMSAQAKLDTQDIEFLYDMEFFIHRGLGSPLEKNFNEEAFRQALAVNGDSIIVIADDEIVKVHVHSKQPGEVLNLALRYGEITQIHILNMREQHRDLLTAGMDGAPMPELFADIPAQVAQVSESAELPAHELAPYGLIAVSSGQGIANIFESLGVDVVLSGGQTMNPSTEDFVKAIHSISAEHIFILPNNSNIILAAQQARDLLEGERQVTVIPSKSIPQGMAAAFAYQEDESVQNNTEVMLEAVGRVKTGQVTTAVRDTVFDDLQIKEGHYIGIADSKIVSTDAELLTTSQALLASMLQGGDEILTILSGQDAQNNVTESLINWVSENYADVEVEVHEGGQPIYFYLFSVES
ncbi:DAK2 domain fusion protein YloV [Paenibacillus turicensis]|uniref:DAK2 domain fusion protein YloV n=1 Tax=Paenibacillus turicensis TaxID=160487 RepID=A0ABS4FPJ3_9BACL|nr:DAK2 domain-containing protein [Paenibacillus turicensis]MBP1904508.1 DAK2 domain fusion protein YloV [Paenibacillus turicensis]